MCKIIFWLFIGAIHNFLTDLSTAQTHDVQVGIMCVLLVFELVKFELNHFNASYQSTMRNNKLNFHNHYEKLITRFDNDSL